MILTTALVKRNRKAAQNRLEEAELIARIKAGDERAFVQLTSRFSEKLYRKAYSMVSSPDDAQDVLQDAYLSAFRAFPKFRAESGVYTWLYRIVVNKAKDYLAKKRNKRENLIDSQEIQFEDDRTNFQESVEKSENTKLLLNEINAMDDIYKDILLQRYFDEMSYQEIAELNGINIGTVKSRLFKAKEILKKRIAQKSQGGDYIAL